MAPARKALGFYNEANDWFCNAGLPSDITIVIDNVNFHLHKFPLSSRCGKIEKLIEETQNTDQGSCTITLENIPGGANAYLVAAKFCYGVRVELTPRNIVIVYCVAGYLEMFDEYGDDNLFGRAENYFHKTVLKNWKDCMVALQSCETVMTEADNLQIISKCLKAISMMACTDPSLFGWPMMMYGRLQSPGGSILWNGINTGARIRSSESDWWFEDISYLGVPLFERLIKTMEARGIRPEKLTGAIMYYSRKYLHGLGRWQGGQSTKARSIASFSMKPAIVDQRVLLESVVKLLPEKKGKSFCRFLLALLRVALILGVNGKCQNSLERKIGMQLELATLDGLLIPTYSDSDTLYNSDCVERIINHFLTSEQTVTTFSPPSIASEVSQSSGPLRKVSKLVDSYMAEVASDVNLKPEKIRSLAEALPESSRSLNDGLYRALDVYFKVHPWLPDKEKEELCNIINYQKLSIDACAHASQNQHLPLRVVLQVLFFEQMQLRTALAGCVNVLDNENPSTGPMNIVLSGSTAMAGQIVQRDGWVTIVRENQVMRVSMERLRSRVGELEEEFNRMRQEMKRVSRTHNSLESPWFLSRTFGNCKLLPRSSNVQEDVVESTGPATPRGSTDQPRASHHSKHR
ncbi:BTB/POZ domain-containing protein At3g44820 isoform X1 [Cynara cardunculus var. scolymus]|uniref:BTB/POZ domain-containing protein At3g44820 isoform X1 n=1 Tax=Cynara cardunculus var. scolymus TaxID=59895 RepID=UPI000D6244F7|nr:BTB/POZ domain-containing protein At3g44820 isoform X1 [Cynara cardunculus var. scolymus]